MSKLKGLISLLISMFIVGFASVCFTIFLFSPISFFTAICGLYSVFILMPSVKSWEKTFNTILNND